VLSVHWFCQDGGGQLNGAQVVQSTAAFAFLTVKDVPDINPQFLNLPNFASIEENSDVVSGVFFVLKLILSFCTSLLVHPNAKTKCLMQIIQ